MTPTGLPALDRDQMTAAYSDPGRPLLVLAGPGSGKTAMLVERITHLRTAPRSAVSAPGAILALTFTRNAARELAARLPVHPSDCTANDVIDVRTFHSFGLWLLRENWAAAYLGWTHVRVATAGQIAQAVAHALTQTGIALGVDDALEAIRVEKVDVITQFPACRRPEHAALRLAYDAWLHERCLIDTHDMLVLPVAILQTHAAARRDLQRRVAHVVADEGQDWSPYQAALVAYAGGPAGRISVVGDHKQAIFGSSTPRYLLELPRAYPGARIVALRRTYRLHAATLAVANAVSVHINGGSVTSIPADRQGPHPLVHLAHSSEEEGAWMAAELARLRATGILRRWADATVLLRTHAQARPIARALAFSGVPCRTQTPALARMPVVAAAMAWLALLHDGTDSAALLHALDATSSREHAITGQSLSAALSVSGPWTMERLHRVCPPDLTEGQKRKLARFIRLYEGLSILAAGREPTVVLDAILERTGLSVRLEAMGYAAQKQFASLRTLTSQESDVGALQHLLAEEVVDDGRDAVHISTVHAFKGQEAEVVFVAGLDEGYFPHHICLERGHAGIQQELRAFYVAITRPRSRLYLSSSTQSATPGHARGPSRFLRLIPPRLLRAA